MEEFRSKIMEFSLLDVREMKYVSADNFQWNLKYVDREKYTVISLWMHNCYAPYEIRLSHNGDTV
jgi:hypothetical protein